MSVTAPPDLPRATDVEALIEAARRRQRRRRLLIAALLSGALLAAVVAFLIRHGAASAPSPVAHGSRQSLAARNGADIRLERPGALALSPGGDLYIADDGRNQILRRLANGRFQVVAGTGKAGFSGDGGPAAHAELNEPGGIALGRDGTLYVADQGNNRIRAIAPNGVISTVAGNGKGGWVKNGIGGFYPRGFGDLVTAPNGSVYAANSETVVRLSSHGMKTVVDFSAQRFSGIRDFLPEGIAVAPNGDIYADTWRGNGYANATALIEVRPGHRPRVLWKQ